jgi:Ca2+/Na+ antiporter
MAEPLSTLETVQALGFLVWLLFSAYVLIRNAVWIIRSFNEADLAYDRTGTELLGVVFMGWLIAFVFGAT